MSTPRQENGKRKYALDYISDPAVYKAVSFALKMIREGTAPGIAIKRASRYYGVAFGDVSTHVAQAAGTVSGWKREVKA